MPGSRVVWGGVVVGGVILLWVTARVAGQGRAVVDFARDVRPIFVENCISCHGAEKQKSGFRLDVKAVALRGGDLGRAILPGEAGKSPLIEYVSGAHPEIRMPPKGKMLAAGQVEVLRAWIDQGAVWPEDGAASRPQAQWSLRPLVKPAVPQVKNTRRVATPVDAFILEKLEGTGLAPSAAADRRTLIRRVTFDLTGLPPTPQEVTAFVEDPAPERAAWGKVIDRLLASPAYGERWARHWMDVVHYAETHGHDEDKPRPNAWPYRDYLIGSFNKDKPYARFVEEQVAGDALFGDDPQGVVATAFLAVGPWDQSSQKGIEDGTLDKQVARYLDRDDMITTVMSTFVSATVHCARCHHHKFDPISQEDYYALQAVFAGVDRVDVPYEYDPKKHVARRDLLKRKRQLQDGTYPEAALLERQVQWRVYGWEAARAESARAWRLLRPINATYAGGSTMGVQADGSVLVGGARPEKDTYTVTCATDLTGITAVRLEVLTDPGLPAQGPGRAENGNLHLSEFRVTAAPRNNPKSTRSIEIARAASDFDQKDWEIGKAIDGKPETAWGVHPQVGRPHEAVFVFKRPVGFDGGTVLRFSLEQVHGRGHLIGRLRLSATDGPAPQKLTPVPEAIAAMLATPAERRSDKQKIELARHVLTGETELLLSSLGPPRMEVYAVASDFEPQGNFKPARKPREVSVLRRGDIRQPVEPASPGALSCVGGVEARFKLLDPQDEAARRAALAKWITHRDNVLTWRSIVNRVWHYHFGRGIVDTPNDLGKMGGTPTHPELLDWLAVTFRDELGGSLKRLHRLIVTSNVYRQSSRHDEGFARVDAENRLLWRMNRARLDAEQVRDAVLSVSGRINLTMGGPSVKQFVESKGLHETPNVDYAAFDVDSPASRRRSVYRFVFRTIPDPLMRSLDCPDASQLTPSRQSSVTPLQALAMLNNAFMVRQSEHLAARLAEIDADPAKQVGALYELALSRPASAEEVLELVRYAQKHGMANACRMVLNSNEFMFVN